MSRDLVKDSVDIFTSAHEAVRPERLIEQAVRCEDSRLRVQDHDYDLRRFSQIIVVGGGKASAAMAAPLEAMLDGGRVSGIVVTKYGHSVPLKSIVVYEAGHPVPDSRGVEATVRLLETVGQCTPDDLVICLFSGGGSALLSSFEDGIVLEDVQILSRLLLSSGAPINEINTVRKHISKVGGGKLARAAHPATVVALVISDVVGDPVESIASGPTVPDPSTFADAWEILSRRSLVNQVPESIRKYLRSGVEGKEPETPKPGDEVFSRCRTLVIGNNVVALDAARRKAASLGYEVRVLSAAVEGESREVARAFARQARKVRANGARPPKPLCLLMGGETTVTIHGNGTGGRNQEFALSAAIELDGSEGIVILSGGTDGTDGPTEVAGAVVDGTTCVRARRMNIEPEKYLENNDSYNFFRQVGGHVVTGPTLTNVMDIMVALVA